MKFLKHACFGVSVIVPTDQYHIIIEKIKKYDIKAWYNKSSLYRFLTYRCDKDFLVKYLESFPNFISKLSVGSYIWANSDVDLLARLHEFELVPEDYRVKAVNSFKVLAVDVPDSGFLRETTKALMNSNELSIIIDSVKNNLLPNLEKTIDDWKDNYDSGEDPDSYFEELISALDDYKDEFEGEPLALKQISFALSQIAEIIDDLKDEYSPDSGDSWWTSETKTTDPANNRSVFDDVDQ
jgi:hypothetical protein